MPPSVPTDLRCLKSPVPRPHDPHDPPAPSQPHTSIRVEPQKLPVCGTCGGPLVITLHGALEWARSRPRYDPQFMPFSDSDRQALISGVAELESYALRACGRALDVLPPDEIPRHLCRLRADLRLQRGDGTSVDDLDAAYFMPLSEAVHVLRTVPIQTGIAEDLSVLVSDEEVKILRALSKAAPRLLKQDQIEQAARVSRRTISGRLRTLIANKLVTRPNGPKSGNTITEAGIAILRQIAAQNGGAKVAQ